MSESGDGAVHAGFGGQPPEPGGIAIDLADTAAALEREIKARAFVRHLVAALLVLGPLGQTALLAAIPPPFGALASAALGAADGAIARLIQLHPVANAPTQMTELVTAIGAVVSAAVTHGVTQATGSSTVGSLVGEIATGAAQDAATKVLGGTT